MAILSRTFSIWDKAAKRERMKRNLTEMSQEQNIERTLNQDFVAPAPYHMPIEVVGVSVREHQHQEWMCSGVIFEAERREMQQV